MASEGRALGRALGAAIAAAASTAAGCEVISGLDGLEVAGATAAGTASSSSAGGGGSGTASGTAGGGAIGGGGAGLAGGSGGAGSGGAAGSASSGGGGAGGATLTYADEVLADDPIGYWRLGEPEGVFNAFDLSGNDLTGDYIGGVTHQSPGAIVSDDDRAMQVVALCDTGTQDHGMDVPHDELFDFDGLEHFTIEVWIRPACENPVDPLRIVERTGEVAGLKNGYSLYYIDGAVNGLVFYRYGAGVTDYLPAPKPLAGAWNHVVAVFGDSGMRVFVNGAPTPFETGPKQIAPLTAPLRIGFASTSGKLSFEGLIDEVAIYAKALPDGRIFAHYQKGLGAQ